MKQFFKMVLAVIVGLLATGLVVLVISTVFAAAIIGSATSQSSDSLVKNSVLKIDLSGAIQERKLDDPISQILNPNDKTLSLQTLLKAIKVAKESDKVKAIYLDNIALSSGFSTLTELRTALEDFKSSGKPIYSYADNLTTGSYYLASLSDSIYLNPSGLIMWSGLGIDIMYKKGLYDKLGVKYQIFKVGKYKSAIEPDSRTDMSEPNRQQLQCMLDDLWGDIVNKVSISRNISADSLMSLADLPMTFQPTEAAVTSGLVDSLVYRMDMHDLLAKKLHLDDSDNIHFVSPSKVANQKAKELDMSGDVIAVYYASGVIDGPTSPYSDNGIVSKDVVKDLKKLADDEDVKAVVIRVNSPGGSAYGSEQMWYAIDQLKKQKPVVVSMGDYAASGGYYMSCNADKIFAEPTTVTGSIGIFAEIPNAQELATKLGITFDGVKTNKFGSQNSLAFLARPLSNDETLLLQSYIDRGYQLFLQRCADGRNKTKEDIHEIAQGRVWTGVQAIKIGLVDELGGLDDAIAYAKETAKLDGFSLISYPQQKTMIEKILKDGPSLYLRTQLLGQEVSNFMYLFDTAGQLQNHDCVQARMIYTLNNQ
ncbi:MAG: signal peptide peptidase SppA [Bacteroidaceae bacterium]